MDAKHAYRAWRTAVYALGKGGIAALLALASGRPKFWRWRSRLTYMQFRARRFGFTTHRKLIDNASTLSVVYHYLKSALVAAGFAGVAAAASLLLDHAVHVLGQPARALGIHLPGLSQGFLNATDAAILQAAVVIIGLYTAAFSVVVSNVYGHIAADLRNVVLKHEISKAFLQSMAFVASYAAMLLLAQGYGLSVGYVSAAILAITLVYGVQTFVSAGIHVFRLFDPLELRPQVYKDIVRVLKGATVTGYRFDDQNFQNWYHEQAAQSLIVLNHMLEACKTPDQVAQLSAFVLELCVVYAQQKRTIPSDSLWFGTRLQYVNWLTASSEQLTLALNNRTSIEPTRQRDDSWFERKIVEILVAALERLKNVPDHSVLQDFNFTYARAITAMTQAMAIREAFQVATAVSPALFAIITKSDGGTRALPSAKLAIASVAATSCKAIAVGLLRSIRNFDVNAIRTSVQDASRDRWRTGQLLPKSAYDALSDLRNNWAFERSIEATLITPTKYGEEIILANILKELWTGIESAKDLFFEKLLPAIEELSKDEPETSAVVAAESYEASAKLEHCVDDIVALEANIKPPKLLDPENWPAFDHKGMATHIDRIREISVVKLADGAVQTIRSRFDPELPDLWGQAYHILAHETFNAIIRGEKDYWQVLARRYLAVAFASIDRMKLETSEPTQFGTWAGQIALDIFEMCGYAMLLSSLDQTDYWSSLKTLLNNLFPQDEGGRKRLQAYLALASYLNDLHMITPRSMLRFYWGREIKDKLKRSHLYGDRRTTFVGRQKVSHPNPTVRTVLQNIVIDVEPFDLFVALYARRRFPDLEFLSKEAISMWQTRSREGHAPRRRRQREYQNAEVLEENGIPWFGSGEDLFGGLDEVDS